MNAIMPTVFEDIATKQPIITTFDQRLVDYLNQWQPGGWPVGNLILVLINLHFPIIYFIKNRKKAKNTENNNV